MPHILLAFLLGLGSWAQDPSAVRADPSFPLQQDAFEDGGSSYSEIRPYRMTRVKSIEIKQNGGWSDNVSSDETEQSCEEFVMTERDVRDFFHGARRISAREYWEELSMSRCFVFGAISFTNGDKGEWRIDRMRRGQLKLSDGRRVYFLGVRARAKAFYDFSPENADAIPTKWRPQSIPNTQSVTIQPSGTTWTTSDDKAGNLCSGFVLTEDDIMDYFQNAQQVPFRQFVSELKASSCSVEGAIRFTNGQIGKWIIERSRRGVLIIPRRETIYFDGKRAHAKVFDQD